MSESEERSVRARVAVAALGHRLSALRLCDATALEAMRRSLSSHGQLSPIVVFAVGDAIEILDGFKRVHAARELGVPELDATTRSVDVTGAKVQLAAMHDGRHLTAIEEAWLVRSLYREDGLTQGVIAQRLGRHKSWVCRRLLLVESLHDALQAEVRLGLLAPRAAVALAALPRGNQEPASAIAIRRGLTVRQTELLVAEILEQPDDDARASFIAHRLEAPARPGPAPARPPTRALRNEADWMAADVATMLRVAARLEARLLATPLGAMGPAASVVFDGLVALAPVVATLARTIAAVTGKDHAA